MGSLSIRTKLFCVVALFASGFLGYLAVVWVTTAERVEDSDYASVIDDKDFVADILPPPMFVLEAYTVALEAATMPRAAVDLEKVKTEIARFEKDFEGRRTYWNAHLGNERMVADINGPAASTAAAVFTLIDHDLIPAIASSQATAATAVLPKLREAYLAHRAVIETLVAAANAEAEKRTDSAAGTIHRRKVALGIFGIVIVIVASGIGFFVARSISRRLVATAAALDLVAGGDFTTRIPVTTNDEVGRMSSNLNRALVAVDDAFQRVRTVAVEMASAAQELAGSSELLASGAQEQAASLEETAASLEEITATVKQSAGNAQQANQLAMSSRETAERGGEIVGQAVIAMTEVTKSSRRIEDIITTIDEIALQTNLLALNAAVEAARAGEQGRGFAVVAAEVGNLAQRSATAAKEVKSLIEDTLSRVDVGNGFVGESGTALSQIIVSVKKVTDLFGEIAAAAREQSAGVDQVNEAVAQMDRVTQGTAAQTSELSRTADGLATQAAQLDTLLAQFQLSGHEAATAPPPARRIEPAKATRPAKARRTARGAAKHFSAPIPVEVV